MSDHQELRDLVRCGIHPKVGTVQILLNDYDRLRQQCDELAGALEYIADPIGAAKRKVAESKGELELDAQMAIRLSECASHLSSIARTALAKYRENA